MTRECRLGVRVAPDMQTWKKNATTAVLILSATLVVISLWLTFALTQGWRTEAETVADAWAVLMVAPTGVALVLWAHYPENEPQEVEQDG